MDVSIEAKKILNEVLDLKNPDDLQFIIDGAKDMLALRKKTVAPDVLSEKDIEELHDGAMSILQSPEIELSGPEAALLSCWLITTETSGESFISRQVSLKLGKLRRASNITKTMEALIDKGFIDLVSDGNGHNRYSLTAKGTNSSVDFIQVKSGKIHRLAG